MTTNAGHSSSIDIEHYEAAAFSFVMSTSPAHNEADNALCDVAFAFVKQQFGFLFVFQRNHGH